jgi:hypothetical protein
MVGNRNEDIHEAEDACEKSFGLAERQAKDLPHGERRLNGCIAKELWFAPFPCLALLLPLPERLL